MVDNLQQRAELDLAFIRNAMERAEGRSSVSGFGSMMIGCTALVACAGFSTLGTTEQQLIAWIVLAPVAAIVGGFANWYKARSEGLTALRDPARRLLLCLLPALGVATVLTAVLWSSDARQLLPAIWLMLYGCGVLAAGTYAATPVMYMGVCFILSGVLLTAAIPALPFHPGNLWLGASFGLFHIIFGWQLYKHHGG